MYVCHVCAWSQRRLEEDVGFPEFKLKWMWLLEVKLLSCAKATSIPNH